MEFKNALKIIKNELDKYDLVVSERTWASHYVLSLLYNYAEHGHEIDEDLIIHGCERGASFGKDM